MSEAITLKVEGMGCQSCVAAVEKAVQAAAPGAKVAITLADGRVVIENAALGRAALASAITDAGYDVIEGG